MANASGTMLGVGLIPAVGLSGNGIVAAGDAPCLGISYAPQTMGHAVITDHLLPASVPCLVYPSDVIARIMGPDQPPDPRAPYAPVTVVMAVVPRGSGLTADQQTELFNDLHALIPS